MTVNYDKLWNILNERGMMKTELIKEAKISTNAMAKLGKNEDVRVGVLAKICVALGCKLDDIVEIEYKIMRSLKMCEGGSDGFKF